ncbi:MAG: fluoride ion transporter CrcB [Acidimicrobiia bacterium]|nr:fluoride ion transporter CrcB [Acidimicrobiia bacterium]
MAHTFGRRRAAVVAIGGAAGAGTRWAVLTWAGSSLFPWPVLALNIAGSVLLGVLLAEAWPHPSARLLLHDVAGIGFCGGLTTFSTFALEVVDLARDGHAQMASAYAVLSVLGAIAGVMAGAAALRRLRAVTLPVEGRP